MKIKHVYLCPDHMDGIFTGIYDAWASRYGHENNRLLTGEPQEPELFSEYIRVEPDEEKAARVAASIQKKICGEAFHMVGHGILSRDPDKADAIYRFLILGFAMGPPVIHALSHPDVHHVFSLERRVAGEINHYMQFLRFSELSGGLLLARIRPENDIIIPVAEHFADRLPEENWLIYEEGRKTMALHRAGYPWVLADGSHIRPEELEHYSEKERKLQELWQRFVDTTGIQERANERLQYSMLPNRYREFMREVPRRGKSVG